MAVCGTTSKVLREEFGMKRTAVSFWAGCSMCRLAMHGVVGLALAGLIFTGGCGETAPPPAPQSHGSGQPASHDGHADDGHGHGDSAGDAGHSHGDHDHTLTSLADGVSQLTKYQQEIQAAFEKKAPEEAHDSLHEIGHVLEAVQEFAKGQESYTEEDKAAINAATEALLEAFGTLDESMHGGEATEYSAVDAKVQEAMAKLQEFVK
jgi:hypothetical protein